MNRLTKRNEKGIAYMAIADSLPKIDQELEGSKPILEGLYAMFQKLAEYEDLEEQGLLIRLPCKIGTKVFYIKTELNGNGFCFFERKIIKETEFTTRRMFDDENWGKTVFLTREEAERALEESNGE